MATSRPDSLYERDFYAWTQQQAKELRRFARTRPNVPLDLSHLAEEIRDLGKSERDEVFSLAQEIMQHFLLVEHSPASERRLHWMDEVDEFRAQIERKISPTIRRHLKRELDYVFARAKWRLVRKMRRYGEDRAAEALPPECPYTLEQVLGEWMPEPAAGEGVGR